MTETAIRIARFVRVATVKRQPHAHLPVDPHTRPLTRGEKVGTVLVAIELVLVLLAATLILPAVMGPGA